MLSLLLRPPGDRPLRLLGLGAHADDLEIGCGGTVLTLLERHPRAEVCWAVFSASPARRAEAEAAAARFLAGAARREVIVHAFRDGFFPYEGAAVKEAVEALAAFRPDVVFTHYRDDRHQDHRALSDLTWNTFRDHLVLEYEIPKYDGDLGRPNLYQPLTDAVAEAKVARLLAAFASQHAKPWFTDETFRALLRLRGVEARARYAEAFYARKLRLG